MPRRSSSLSPGRVKGVPAAGSTVGDLYRGYLADRAAGIPQKETDKAVRLPDERKAAKDQRRDIYAMRGNQTPAYEEWDIQNALYDAMDHADAGDDNMIRVGEMPRFVTGLTGIEGDFYLYRNHAYENTVTAAEAKQAGRFDKSAHYHGLGMEKMTDAIQSLEHPIMTIATKTKDGNPAVIMLLPVKGSNGAPLYGVLSFYSNKAINGDMSRRPHVVLTIAERNFTEAGGRTGIEDVVRNGIKEGRVLSFEKTMRDDLSLTADTVGIGSITEPSLKENVARFRKEIKGFKEKNKINYSVSGTERDSAGRELSAEQAEFFADSEVRMNENGEWRLGAGSLVPVYHATDAEFHTFQKNKAGGMTDPENEHLILQAIFALTRGKTILTIAHRLATIEQADQILVVEDGRITEYGTHAELIRRNGLYKRFTEIREQAEGWHIAAEQN